MIVEGLMAMTLLTADSQNGSLKIDVQQEDQENKNRNLDQYNTHLFDQESDAINTKLKEHKQEQNNRIKNNMFQDAAGKSSRLSETKKVLFAPNDEKSNKEIDKAPYIQQIQEKHIFPYILMSIGAFLTIGFVIFTIIKGRKRERNEST